METNLKITDYLDINLNLYNNTISPYRKANKKPCYINIGSNHPKQTFKHIPNGIGFRLSTNSSNIKIFEKSKFEYEQALKNSGYTTKIPYRTTNETARDNNKRKNRARQILWFNPPYNMAVKNNIGKDFF